MVRFVDGRVSNATNTTKNYINEQINAQNRSLALQRDAINTVKQDVTVSVGKVNKELDEQKDVLRGEIGQAKADAIAQADNNAKVVRGELKQQGDSCVVKSAVSKGCLRAYRQQYGSCSWRAFSDQQIFIWKNQC